MKTTLFRGALAALLVAASALPAAADTAPGWDFGVAAGSTSGTGLTARYWTGPLGFQVSALPALSNSDPWLILGGQVLVPIGEDKNSRFFGYVGGAQVFNEGDYPEPKTTAGTGFGWEFVLFDHLCADIQAGYGLDIQPGGRFTSTFSVETSFFYRTQR